MNRLLLAGLIALTAPVMAAGKPSPAKPAAKTEPKLSAQPRPAPNPVTRLSVEPKRLQLTHARDERCFVVMARYADDTVQDVTAKATYAVANPRFASVERDGTLRPLDDGETVLTATFGGQAATVPVEVIGAKREIAWDFATQVAPIFSKYGCNSANCHGSPVGKPSTENSFKLSLFGDDPSFDFDQLNKDFKDAKKTRERVNLKAAEESLLYRKPTGLVPHGGGPRFDKDSPPAKLLRDWIAAGAVKGAVYAPSLSFLGSKVTDIDVFPKERIFSKKGDQQRLVVMAKFENGLTEDITSRARFSPADDEIARVTNHGVVTAAKDGETVIVVRYLNFVKAPKMMVVTGRALRDYPPLASNNFIDDLVARKWRKIRVLPSELAGEEEFARRVYLDLIGQLPTVPEVRDFVADREPTKRSRLIDALLERNEYVDFWTVRWGDLLRCDRRYVTPKGMWTFHDWIRESVAANKPWDQFVREIVVASGSTYRSGPANFWRVLNSLEERTSALSQAFLGTRIECARCHNHPFDKWTNDDYHGLAAFFVRLQLKNGELTDNSTLSEQVLIVNRSGDHTRDVPNRPKQVMNPKLLGAQPLPKEGEADRRQVFADWLTARDNQQFARALVNRLWGHLMGRGIVEPVDDFRVSNPPINEELLEALAKDFIAHNFDVKHVLRTIANSRVYQLTWKPNDTNGGDHQNFSRHYVQRLTAEQLLDAINQVTAVPDKFGELPAGTKAIQLPDTANMGYFLDIFGKPKRQLVCECERNTFGNMSQALHLINSPQIQSKIASGNGRVAKLIAAAKTDLEIVEDLYLAALQRRPNSKELKEALDTIDQAPTRPEGCEDVLWALLNSREFIFNH